MPISFMCNCGAKLQAKDDKAGALIECPKCGERQQVPGNSIVLKRIKYAPVTGGPPVDAQKPNLSPGVAIAFGVVALIVVAVTLCQSFDYNLSGISTDSVARFLMMLSLLLLTIHLFLIGTRGLLLPGKFAKLGTLRGRSKNEIIAVAGPPNAVSTMADGRTVLQWVASGYHIAIVFDGETCEGVTHEAKFGL